jgi:hypothetical protein
MSGSIVLKPRANVNPDCAIGNANAAGNTPSGGSGELIVRLPGAKPGMPGLRNTL